MEMAILTNNRTHHQSTQPLTVLSNICSVTHFRRQTYSQGDMTRYAGQSCGLTLLVLGQSLIELWAVLGESLFRSRVQGCARVKTVLGVYNTLELCSSLAQGHSQNLMPVGN